MVTRRSPGLEDGISCACPPGGLSQTPASLCPPQELTTARPTCTSGQEERPGLAFSSTLSQMGTPISTQVPITQPSSKPAFSFFRLPGSFLSISFPFPPLSSPPSPSSPSPPFPLRGFKLTSYSVLLLQPPKPWDYSCASSYPAQDVCKNP